MQYLFILGTSPGLSQAEIESALNLKPQKNLTSEILLVKDPKSIDPGNILSRLGGTVKIAEVIGKTTSRNELLLLAFETLKSQSESRIIFGLSIYGKFPLKNLKELNRDLKDKLEDSGCKARFILPSEGNILSSVQISKEKIKEIIIAASENTFYLGKTLEVQDFEEWGMRDYQRPFADPKRGMVPPKVARMMVNLAIGKVEKDDIKIIWDPFCGVGTIGAESLMQNCWSINSDQDKEAVDKTSKNLQWLCKTFNLPAENFKVFQKEAANIGDIKPRVLVDAVVTEPYLGPSVGYKNKVPVINRQQRLTPGKLENILIGLERMYQGSLKEWKKILKPSGKIVIITPRYQVWGKEYFMKNLIDTCEKLGYNIEAGPYEYARPQAVVKRNIYVLGVKSTS